MKNLEYKPVHSNVLSFSSFCIFTFLAIAWFVTIFTFYILGLSNLTLGVKIVLFFFVIVSLTVYWVWVKWSYEKLLELKKNSALSKRDNCFFVIAHIIKLIFGGLIIKILKSSFILFFTLSYFNMGQVLVCLLVIILSFYFFLRYVFEYTSRNEPVVILSIGIYGSTFLIISETNYFNHNFLLCCVVFITSITQFVYLFLYDAYCANLNKDTLLWKLQYISILEYIERAKLEIKPELKFWKKYWNKRSKNINFYVFLELPLYSIISFYSCVTNIYPFTFLGKLIHLYLIYHIFCYLNFIPFLFFFGPFFLISCLCSTELFKNYIAKTYHPTQLKELLWNTSFYSFVNAFRNITRSNAGAVTATGVSVYAVATAMSNLENNALNANYEELVRRQAEIDRKGEAEHENNRQRGDDFHRTQKPYVRTTIPLPKYTTAGGTFWRLLRNLPKVEGGNPPEDESE